MKLIQPSFCYDKRNENHIPKIIGICNGVVCFKKAKEIVLYNPATRAYRQVPRRRSYAMCRDELIAYDCVSDDFKIISFIQHFTKSWKSESETYIYKLKDNSWSKIEFPPRRFHCELSSSHIANNSLYWITYNYDSEYVMLMRFDVTNHRFKETPLPIHIIYSQIWDIRLRVLKERLHMIIMDVNRFEIWMLKDDDNCWTRVFCCFNWIYREKFCLSPLRKKFPWLLQYGSSKDESKIMVAVEEKREMLIISCDIESRTTSMLNAVSLPEHDTFSAMSWAESLVPLG